LLSFVLAVTGLLWRSEYDIEAYFGIGVDTPDPRVVFILFPFVLVFALFLAKRGPFLAGRRDELSRILDDEKMDQLVDRGI